MTISARANTFQATLPSGHLPQLDALRGLAILAVILHNAGAHGLEAPSGFFSKAAEMFGAAGWVGVQLFFVLSGFLITGILVDGLGKPHQLRNFYMRRTLRIFPVYYTFLFAIFILVPFLGASPAWVEHAATHQVWYWFYLINWAEPWFGRIELGHLWSLAVEEQFYLIWPWVVLATSRQTLAHICAALVLVALVTRVALVAWDPTFAATAAYTFTTARLDALALGALLALALRNGHWLAVLRRWAPRLTLGVAMLLCAQVAAWHYLESVNGPLGVLNQTTVALFFTGVIFLVIVPGDSGQPALHSKLDNPLLCAIGKVSYAAYVIHIPVKYYWFSNLGLMPGTLPDGQQVAVVLYNFLGVTAITLAIAFVSWHVLEKPFLSLKRHFVR